MVEVRNILEAGQRVYTPIQRVFSRCTLVVLYFPTRRDSCSGRAKEMKKPGFEPGAGGKSSGCVDYHWARVFFIESFFFLGGGGNCILSKKSFLKAKVKIKKIKEGAAWDPPSPPLAPSMILQLLIG